MIYNFTSFKIKKLLDKEDKEFKRINLHNSLKDRVQSMVMLYSNKLKSPPHYTMESEEYFNSRPKGSRISAIVSKQSEEIESFESFQKIVEEAINTLDEKEIKLPDHCGIYKITPVEIEIWKEGEFRRHERTLFKLKEKKWIKSYLSP